MKRLDQAVRFESGTAQFRIVEAFEEAAPQYTFYGQHHIEADLIGMIPDNRDSKHIRTFDQVSTLHSGDVVWSLMSGVATVVTAMHEGYIYTQNYVKLVTGDTMDARFLVYLLNEDGTMRQQLLAGVQGSQVLKYTLKQVRELELPPLPKVEKQRLIGALYFHQLRLQALKSRVAQRETTHVLQHLKEALIT